jgi:hypothetical protein
MGKNSSKQVDRLSQPLLDKVHRKLSQGCSSFPGRISLPPLLFDTPCAPFYSAVRLAAGNAALHGWQAPATARTGYAAAQDW